MNDDTAPADGLADLRLLGAALADALDAGDAEGLLAPRSTFTLAETIEHAAQSISYAMDGYPKLSPAPLRHTVGRAVKHVFLGRGRMRHDLAAPVPGAPDVTATDATHAAAALRSAIERLHAHTDPLHPHPVYGRCTVPQAARLQAMHLREHLPGLNALAVAA